MNYPLLRDVTFYNNQFMFDHVQAMLDNILQYLSLFIYTYILSLHFYDFWIWGLRPPRALARDQGRVRAQGPGPGPGPGSSPGPGS